MTRLVLPIVAGLVLGGIVHLVAVLILPYYAEQDAYARLSAIGSVNAVAQMDDPSAFGAVLPDTDPAFISAVCLYDLGDGPLKVRVPTTADYTSVSFYTRFGLAFYAINDRSAGRRVIELDLMNPTQKAAMPENADVTAADRLVVESPSDEGIVLIRALVRERSAREAVRAHMSAASCGPAS
ncbi:DUF1254 domain-containing protein [Ancylobacter mangrovi]|uniref:DUF1254 domain-containing protein n=1 Tax=Ancylobacter mangrovi TaxID=2972472 RepID=UPI002162428A|nr:DUF1254 domain-containing protein [Ancylobacter mangrovi]MCS0501064.1 DUF1254 domain-containing protein [Ancylobacter mangrovi]